MKKLLIFLLVGSTAIVALANRDCNWCKTPRQFGNEGLRDLNGRFSTTTITNRKTGVIMKVTMSASYLSFGVRAGRFAIPIVNPFAVSMSVQQHNGLSGLDYRLSMSQVMTAIRNPPQRHKWAGLGDSQNWTRNMAVGGNKRVYGTTASGTVRIRVTVTECNGACKRDR